MRHSFTEANVVVLLYHLERYFKCRGDKSPAYFLEMIEVMLAEALTNLKNQTALNNLLSDNKAPTDGE